MVSSSAIRHSATRKLGRLLHTGREGEVLTVLRGIGMGKFAAAANFGPGGWGEHHSLCSVGQTMVNARLPNYGVDSVVDPPAAQCLSAH